MRGRFFDWVNRVLDADERYICASCDDRFPGRTEGVAHVAAFHPEFPVLANAAVGNRRTPAPEPSPARLLGTRRRYTPIWG